MDTHEPRWLNAEERQTWLSLAAMVINLSNALDTQLQRDAHISHFEYQVLATLSEATERTMRMSDLAVITNGSLSRLSHVVKRLEKQGWVRRTPTRTTAATPWPSSPKPAGRKSSPPPPAMSKRFAASSSTRSPRPSSGPCAPSATA